MEEEQYTSAKTGCSTCSRKAGKLDVYDWLSDLPEGTNTPDLVEVRFKNTRKSYFKNATLGRLEQGDIVAVEATPGHDIGEVTCTGEMVVLQMKKNNVPMRTFEFKRVYRKAKPLDLEKWEESKLLESETMLEARKIAVRLNLNMKIGDVEYQGDKTKAIFYYIADERVDFRELIKVLAERFKVRIEMRQIGARQEAGRIGGIGPCGRELCCSSWMTNFVSVTTNSARYQEISLNPQKLAGQCGKLKCCLNYELDAYLDAQQDFPRTHVPLETDEGTFYHFKTDIFKRIMWYSSDQNMIANAKAVSVDRVKEVIALNKKGKKALVVTEEDLEKKITPEIDFQNVIGQDSLTRFDVARTKGGNNSNRNKGRNNKPRVEGQAPRPQGERPTPRPQAEKNSSAPQGEKVIQAPHSDKNAPHVERVKTVREPSAPQEPRNSKQNERPAPQLNAEGKVMTPLERHLANKANKGRKPRSNHGNNRHNGDNSRPKDGGSDTSNAQSEN